MFLICFDIHDARRLRNVARQMENFGVRVQRSVFECHLNRKELLELQKRLAIVINEEEDKVRYYSLCEKDKNAILIDGVGRVTTDVNFVLV
ncbi:MAG TPA: CRISPR-associated endonuclease Cas2 [Desulfobacterales bacterium]|nr:CRISPR-associated endonuclease Cas2 [Desulfobacterales bacterium]HIP38853.1 CRISPR-associated endonuclease Cas2 [Desulfocapsa sulfexigens]